MKILFYCSLFLVLLCNRASACDCIIREVTYYVRTSEFVLLVTAKEIHPESEPYNKGHKATVVVNEIFKGNVQTGQELEFDSDDSNCLVRFEPGVTYLIFAYKKGDKYYNYHCTPWGKADSKYTRTDIRKIRNYVKRWRPVVNT